MFWKTAVGLIESLTVTVEVHVELFALSSVTVRVTVLAPRLAQVNAVGVALKDTDPQLSLDPASISAATIEAFPAPSRKTVIF